MEILILVFIIILLFGIEIRNNFKDEGYLSKNHTLCCKGLLSLLIVFCHIQYNRTYLEQFKIFNYAGNFIVSIFFFYSGYGIMFNYIIKGIEYKKKFLKKRILKILEIYLIFNLIYIFVDLLLGIDISNIILNKELIVSHSWYIVDTLILYFGYWISIKISNNNNIIVLFNFIYGCLIIKILNCVNLDTYWYITVLNFPLGIIYSILKEKIDKIVLKDIDKDNIRYVIDSFMTLGLFFILLIIWIQNIDYIIKILVYMLATIIFINMGRFIKFKNHTFEFLGKISMEVYLTHGLLEIIGQKIYIIDNNNFLYGCFVISGTIIIGIILNKVFAKIFKGGNNENISSKSDLIHI